MKIHEYQGKDLFRKFGIPVPRGVPAFSVDQAVSDAEVRSAYDGLQQAFHEEFVIWEAAQPEAATGSTGPGRR